MALDLMNLRRRLGILLRQPDAGLGRTLSLAIRHAHGDELSILGRSAIESKLVEPCSTLIRHLHRLPDDEREPLLTAAALDWPTILEPLAIDPDEAVQRNLVHAVRALNQPRLSPLLARLMRRRQSASMTSPESSAGPLRFRRTESPGRLDHQRQDRHDWTGEPVGGLAEAALLELTMRAAGPDGAADCAGDDRFALEQSLIEMTASAGDHPSRDLALAAIRLSARPSDELSAWFATGGDAPIVSAMRRLARDPSDPDFRPNVIRWLGHPIIGQAIARSIHVHVEAGGFATTLARDGALLRSPARSLNLRHASRPARAVPPVEQWPTMSPDARRHLVRWILRLPLSTASRGRLLAECLDLRDPLLQVEAAEALAGIRGRRAADELAPLHASPSPMVARRLLSSVRSERIPVDLNVIRAILAADSSPPARRYACKTLANASPEDFIGLIDQVSSSERSVIARSHLRSADRREDLLARMSDALLNPKRSTRVRIALLQLVERLRLHAAFEKEILALCEDDDRRLAATAVRASRHVRSDRRAPIIRAALLTSDDRIRANAVEAIVGVDRRTWKDRTRMLDLLTQDSDNRTRANALRILLDDRSPHAAPALKRMLQDSRPRHRISALWAVASSRALGASALVRRLADEDPIPIIRARAAAVLDSLPPRSPARPSDAAPRASLASTPSGDGDASP